MKVVVLSDNKPGHYKQSLGIVKGMPESHVQWVEVRFRQKWRDNLLRGFTCIFGGTSISAARAHDLLRWSLTHDSYEALSHIRSADMVLSTGSSVASVNLLLGRLLGAKTVTCRRPSPVGTRYFDLAILPMLSWQDASHQRNICRTIGVPNPISPDLLDAERTRLIGQLNLPDLPRIGVLLGGTDPHETITVEDAVQLNEICKSIATRMHAQLLVTTSRRTPPDVATYLASTLKQTEVCPLFVDPNTDSELEDPYQAILALSDLLIVTADSFSMVCEAASSGRNVIVLTLTQERLRLPQRYEVYEYLEERTIVKRCGIDTLEACIVNLLASHAPNTPLQDTQTAVDAIYRLI